MLAFRYLIWKLLKKINIKKEIKFLFENLIHLKIDLQIPITMLGAILMDKSGRRPLMMVNKSA
jgi:hypothetical protein